ncbi:L,D-transpeptidase family protein [Bacillus suaedaesalsae]|uniref:L,D-transpeptidase family protein n=1 Tax=Bacillus suaedaesalsae TaxID=2810349 RepID=A0ABS2DEB7_9BACI|nr:L,D-transpeptidase family protein [Bacillus suaedaesalsae]MBM6616807.1 L,D-transpeptidase family protein [Bacillus suaedaesalsae]
MEPRSRKETYKQKRKNRRAIQLVIPSIIICISIFFLYEYQSVEVEKPIVKTDMVSKEKQVEKSEETKPVQEIEVKQELVETEKPKVVIQKNEGKTVSPLSSPIVKGVNKKEKQESIKPQATSGVVIIHHTLDEKETLYSIAKRYYKNDKLQYLINYNGIDDPSVDVKVGDTIKVPNPYYLGKHVVHKGETLFSIGRKYFSKSQIVQYMTEINHSSEVKTGESLIVFNQGKLTKHTVKEKETLFGIMNHYYQFSDYLKLIKDVNSIGEQVPAGQSLFIPNPFYKASEPINETSWSIEILLNNHTLTLYKDKNVYKTYSVATGKESLTPRGTFQVITKFKNPEYTPKKIAGGDPLNPLGTRWIGLNVPDTTGRTYGIHGTSNPNSIGKDVSQGCVRLHNAHIEQLFEIVPIGTEVIIK